jgi:hypothetical protein
MNLRRGERMLEGGACGLEKVLLTVLRKKHL